MQALRCLEAPTFGGVHYPSPQQVEVSCTFGYATNVATNYKGGKMSVSIRIDDALYQTAKVRANAEMRSIPQQVAYWAKVGRAALDNPDLSVEFVRDVLVAMDEEAEPFELPEA